MIKRALFALPLMLAATPDAFAQVVVDYRDPAALELADSGQWSDVAAEIGGDIEVLGAVDGAFTAAGAEETAYLVSSGAPVAADPFPAVEQRLVIFAEGALVADWALPEDGALARPVTATDLDGDGIFEVIAEGSFYNMGTLALGLSVIKVGEAPEIIQTLPEVYMDSCEAGVGERSIIASAVSVVDGELVAEEETLDCP